MTVLSYLYGIILHRAINAPGHGNNVVDGLNGRDKCYLIQKIELIGKLESNNTSKIVMLNILNNKEELNGIKGSTKTQKIESLLKTNHTYTAPKGNLMLITEV